MKKLLITGASGFLGWNTCRHPQRDWKITGTYHRHPQGLYPGTDAFALDLLQSQEVGKAIDRVKPDAILHLAAQSSTGICVKHPQATRRLNVEATGILTEWAMKHSIPLVFTSSEQVYDGTRQIYTDTAAANPLNVYGKQKWAAEQVIQQLYPIAGIARIAVLFGVQGASTYCFMSDWLQQWKEGGEVNAFYDEIRSFLYVGSAVEALLLMLGATASGVYNVGGANAMSRFDFAQLLAKLFGYRNAKIKAMSRLDIPEGETRPASLIIDNHRIKQLGFAPMKIIEGLKETANDG